MCQKITKVFECEHHVPEVFRCSKACGTATTMPPEISAWFVQVRSGEEPESPSQWRMEGVCEYCRTARPWYQTFLISTLLCIIVWGHYGLSHFLIRYKLVSWDYSCGCVWAAEERLGTLMFMVAYASHRYLRYLTDGHTRRSTPGWPPFIPNEPIITGKYGNDLH